MAFQIRVKLVIQQLCFKLTNKKHQSSTLPPICEENRRPMESPHKGNNNVECVLTHWGRDEIDAILQTTFSNAFSWMKMYEFRLRFHWRLFLRVQLIIFQHWLRLWLGADQATSHYLNQWWLFYWRIYASLGLNELMQSHHHVYFWNND